MADPSSHPVFEGVFGTSVAAINKPPSLSSAQVIRDAQEAFRSSTLFKPWFDREQERRDGESHNQKRKRRSWKQRQPLQLKMGHGGTLDPMATGVLILGVGNGTKSLNKFLECTKSYECVVLFGAATDSYDSVGKIVARKPFEHITKTAVEEAVEKFRGNIMQKPPIFSALRVQGKKLYEYAREGKEVPVEIEERPVRVDSLEMVEWLDGGKHEYHWPAEEAEKEEKEIVEKVLHLEPTADSETKRTGQLNGDESSKRKRDDDAEPAHFPKRSKSTPEPVAADTATSSTSSPRRGYHPPVNASRPDAPPCPAPACRIRMTVTSGFYVRSFCHDLGAAVSSLGLMASLVRTRQGDFELGRNALDYDDLAKDEDVWGPKVQGMLEAWRDNDSG